MSKRAGENNVEKRLKDEETKKSNPQLEDPLNMTKWIEDNKSSFLPPVCNKLMYGAGQLKVMLVGGPNARKDYHIDEGEEFFYMIKGDLLLRIIEKGRPKELIIKEGEVFVLPSRIQHSPQRLENTVGLVIERERLPDESDGLRYFCEDGVTPLWEKWFHCEDLGTQLAPIIKEYFSSESFKTGVPDPDNIAKDPPVEVDSTSKVDAPLSLKEWIDGNKSEIECGTKELFGKGEFKINIHGQGEQLGEWQGETWLYQLEGEACVTVNGETKDLGKDDVIIIPSGAKYTVKRAKGSIGMSVIMDPMANK